MIGHLQQLLSLFSATVCARFVTRLSFFLVYTPACPFSPYPFFCRSRCGAKQKTPTCTGCGLLYAGVARMSRPLFSQGSRREIRRLLCFSPASGFILFRCFFQYNELFVVSKFVETGTRTRACRWLQRSAARRLLYFISWTLVYRLLAADFYDRFIFTLFVPWRRNASYFLLFDDLRLFHFAWFRWSSAGVSLLIAQMSTRNFFFYKMLWRFSLFARSKYRSA